MTCKRLPLLRTVGVVHGDVNRFNFIVNDTGEARLIDFATIDTWSYEAGSRELEGLQSSLADTLGAGAPYGYLGTA